MGNRGVKDEKISWKHITAGRRHRHTAILWQRLAARDECRYDPAGGALYGDVAGGILGMLAAGLWSSRLLKNRMTDDPFNAENESFMQETRLLKNDDSFNFPTEFVFRRRRHSGWINVVNPFRASIVLGTPGSGKSYALINNYIKQAIERDMRSTSTTSSSTTCRLSPITICARTSRLTERRRRNSMS
ncbi:hypothetical protein [Alistipes putredinis]|uniref:hypothetical protein n=1 Tax=Alistipes putredinis TaxID=28117 RepID=UPI003991B6BE